MEHLSEAQLDRLRAALEGEASQLRAGISAAREVVADSPEAEPRDIEDAAAHDAGRFTAKQLLDRARRRLAEIEAALARIDSGDYGLCEESGEDIPFGRLRLEPTTRYTVEALEERERVAEQADPYAHEPVGY